MSDVVHTSQRSTGEKLYQVIDPWGIDFHVYIVCCINVACIALVPYNESYVW